MNTTYITYITCKKMIEYIPLLSQNDWYNRVYLCFEDTDLKKPNTYGPIKGFNCYKYHSFETAVRGWDNVKVLQKNDLRHTMIPICKWVPVIFDRYILDWKLKNMYWLGKHTLSNGYNKKW